MALKIGNPETNITGTAQLISPGTGLPSGSIPVGSVYQYVLVSLCSVPAFHDWRP